MLVPNTGPSFPSFTPEAGMLPERLKMRRKEDVGLIWIAALQPRHVILLMANQVPWHLALWAASAMKVTPELPRTCWDLSLWAP